MSKIATAHFMTWCLFTSYFFRVAGLKQDAWGGHCMQYLDLVRDNQENGQISAKNRQELPHYTKIKSYICILASF